MLRLLILSDYLPEDQQSLSLRPDDRDTAEQAGHIKAAAERLGMKPSLVRYHGDSEGVLSAIESFAPDVVFNMAEGQYAAEAALLLEGTGVPFTGGSSRDLLLSTNKLWTKKVAMKAQIPVARAYERHDLTAMSRDRLFGKFLVKAVDLDSSLGLLPDSLLESPTPAEILSLIARREDEFKTSFFAEEFLPGTEYKIGMIENEQGEVLVLPPREVSFLPGAHGFLHYETQWNDDLAEQAFFSVRLMTEEDHRKTFLQELARRVWNEFSLSGYVRADFKEDEGGTPKLMEINISPGISPGHGFTEAFEAYGGRPYDDMIRQIIATAMKAGVRDCPRLGGGGK